MLDLRRARRDGPAPRGRPYSGRPREGRPGDDPSRERHRFPPRLFRRHRNWLRRTAGLADADRRRGADARGRLRRFGHLSPLDFAHFRAPIFRRRPKRSTLPRERTACSTGNAVRPGRTAPSFVPATRRGFRKDRRVRGGAGVHGATDSGLTRCRIDSRPGCEQAGAWSPFRPFRPCSCAEQGNNLPCYFCSPRPIFHRRLYRNPLGRNLFPDRRGRGERTLRPCSLRDNRVKQGTIP